MGVTLNLANLSKPLSPKADNSFRPQISERSRKLAETMRNGLKIRIEDKLLDDAERRK